MASIAVMCTQASPERRPFMNQVVQVGARRGAAERGGRRVVVTGWAASSAILCTDATKSIILTNLLACMQREQLDAFSWLALSYGCTWQQNHFRHLSLPSSKFPLVPFRPSKRCMWRQVAVKRTRRGPRQGESRRPVAALKEMHRTCTTQHSTWRRTLEQCAAPHMRQ